MKNTSILIAILFIAGCSNQAIYENIQLNNRNKCSELPQSQYEECMEAASETYDEYERERQEITE